MYPYGGLTPQGQQQQHPQNLLQMSRPSPPQSSWAIPQPHPSYYGAPRGPVVGGRQDSGHSLARTDVNVTQPAVTSSDFYSNSMAPPTSLAPTDFFPGVIDTSKVHDRAVTGAVLTTIGPWGQKVCEELESFPSLDPDVTDFSNGIMGHDENTPIIDLRQYNGMPQQEHDSMANLNPHTTRRLSESSFSMSSTGGVLPEPVAYEDLGTSEPVSYPSEYDTWSRPEPSQSHLLSPLASPCRPQYDGVVRSGSRSRASPAPHNNVRSSPYTLDSGRFKRWSTGHAPTSTPANARTVSQVPNHFTPYGPRMNPHHSMPAYPSGAYNNYGMAAQNVLYSQTNPQHTNTPPYFGAQDQSPYHLEVPRPLPSQGLFRLLQSNADRHGGCSSHFADLSDPPDLYSSLHEEASNPPESDMNPSDPDLIPHEQDLRFVGDLYTPRWVRGHGNKREGWCGLCKPGRWLVLKNSAFWYDKSFTHGVSAATGAAFQGPQETRRTEGNLDVWEGLCGSCGEWIALVSNKKKGTTWFRHAYKVSLLRIEFARPDWSPLQIFNCTYLKRSATHTRKSKTVQKGVGKRKPGEFAQCHLPRRPRLRTRSSMTHCKQTRLLIDIPRPPRSQVAHHYNHMAGLCQRLRRHRPLDLAVRVIQAVLRTPRLLQQHQRCSHSGRPQWHRQT